MSLRTTITVLLLTLALGHDRFAVRERAQAALMQLCRLADVTTFLRSLKSEDTEIQQRVSIILRKCPVAKLEWYETYRAEWVGTRPYGNRYIVTPGINDDWELYINDTRGPDAALVASGFNTAADARVAGDLHNVENGVRK